jgi:hypothetical protein
MKIGDLVKMKHWFSGHPNIGLVVATDAGGGPRIYTILWDLPEWNSSRWDENDLAAVNESR